MTEPFRIVLVEPQIPWNTGNVGRSCVGAEAELHLAGKLGFSLEDRYLKRAGLDYWPSVRLFVHPDARTFLRGVPEKKIFLFSTHATKSLWDVNIPAGSYLVFGSETRGLPACFHKAYARRFYKIPLTGPIRSLNLSTAVGMVLGEALRQNNSRRKRK